MDPVTGSIVGSVASSLIGGLFGGGGSSKSEWVTPKYSDIRKKAEAAGFNPLTALSMNGGGVGTSTQAPTFGQRVANAALGVSDAMNTAKDYQLQETALEQREREIAIKEKAAENLARQSRVSTGIGQRQVEGVESLGSKFEGATRQVSDIVPLARPTAKSAGVTPVFNPSGGMTLLNKRQADRLNLLNFDMMMVEDFEALGGDEMGQVMAVPHIPNIPNASFGGLKGKSLADFYDKTPKEKTDAQKDAAYSAFESVFGY